MGSELSTKVLGSKGIFTPQSSIAGCIFYFGNIMEKIKNDPDFTAIKLTKTATAITAIATLKTAEEGRIAGTVTTSARNDAFRMMISKCKAVLAIVNKFASDHPTQSKDVLQRNDIKIRTRKGYTRDSIEIRHGKLSGTFDLLQASQGQRTAYIWMIREKGTSKWKLADFSHKTTGLYVGATPGIVYQFIAQYKNKKGKSAFTQIVEIICI